MKLLVITQKVNAADSNLGFFHIWLERLAERVEQLHIVCLEAGEHHLPSNVQVWSLGKEQKKSRLSYVWRFYKYILLLRHHYDGVFVHMNPEYVVLGGWWWRWWGKPTLLWYVHKSITWKLRLAEKLITRIYTASAESFLLPSHKIHVVGHGIDVDFFSFSTWPKDWGGVVRLLTVGRITPAKDLLTMLRALSRLVSSLPSGYKIYLDIVGAPVTAADPAYMEEIKSFITFNNLESSVSLLGPKHYRELPAVYRDHQIFLNASQTGLDKAILEALASGLVVWSSSHTAEQLPGVISFPPGDDAYLAGSIEKSIVSGILEPNQTGRNFVVAEHNLNVLIDRIIRFFNS